MKLFYFVKKGRNMSLVGDNSDLQALYRAELEQGKGDELAKDQVYQAKRIQSSDPGGGEFLYSGARWATFAAILVGIGLILYLSMIFFVGKELGNRAGFTAPGDNCTFIQCPAGPDGPPGAAGPAGPPGAQGIQGPQGPTGPVGAVGPAGPKGDTGLCDNTNPFCLQGAVGPQGIQGPPGPTGPGGLIGPTGPQGNAGPMGLVGPSGPSGPSGATGPQGPQGVPGAVVVPDPLTVNELTVNTGATFGGTVTCTGGAIDASCFGLGSCASKDLSACQVTARTLLLDNDAFGTTILQVGQTGHTMPIEIIFGDATVPFDAYLIDLFRFYTKDAFLDARDSVTFTVGNGVVVGDPAFTVNVVGLTSVGISLNTPNSLTDINSGGGINIANNGAGSVYLTNSAGYLFNTASDIINTSGNSTTEDTDVFNVRSPSGSFSWLLTTRNKGLECNSSVPHTDADPPVDEIRIGAQLRLSPETSILTENPDGRIRASGFDLCTGQVYTHMGVPLDLYSANGTTITSPTITLNGDVTITGTLNGQTITADAPCCDSSDMRVKDHIVPMNISLSWDRIRSLEPVEYKFKEAYQKVDKWVGDHVHRGFLAQKVKTIVPRAVHTVEKQVGNMHFDDFHLIKLNHIIPDLVGAIHFAHDKIKELEDKIQKLLDKSK